MENERDKLFSEMQEIMQKAERDAKQKLEQFNLINSRDPSADYANARLGWYFIMKGKD